MPAIIVPKLIGGPYQIAGATVSAGNAVTFDALGSATLSSGAATSDNSITVTGGLTNPGLIYVMVNGGGVSVTSPSAAWDTLGSNQAMTLLVNQDAGGGRQVLIFGLRNPVSGNKRLVVTGTGMVSTVLVARGISFSHVNQTSDATAFPGFTGTSTATTPASLTITSGTNNYVIAGYSEGPNFSSVSDTQLLLNNTLSNWATAANYKVSTGATDTLTASPGGGSGTYAGGTIAHD